ncbi:MAG: hypothetical protein WBO92_04065, partial [Candidatus Moraniibacteriota bacterium]
VLPRLPRLLHRRLERPMKYGCIALGITIAGMIMAKVWQWLFDVKNVKYLFDGVPAVFEWLTFAGLISFVFFLFATVFVIPLLYDLEVRWKAWKRRG